MYATYKTSGRGPHARCELELCQGTPGGPEGPQPSGVRSFRRAQKPIVYVPRNFTAQGHGKVALRILQESCFGQIPRACRKLCNCVEECKSGRPIATKHYVAQRSNPACACAGAPYLSVLVLLVAFTLAATPASLPSMTGARAQDCGRPAVGAQRLRLTWPKSAMTDPILSGVGHCNIVPPPFFSTSRSTPNNYWYYFKLDYLHILRTSIGPHAGTPQMNLTLAQTHTSKLDWPNLIMMCLQPSDLAQV